MALKLAANRGAASSYAQLASELGLSASQVHASMKRADISRLVHAKSKNARKKELAEFLVHGLKYMLPAELGPVARGVPTGHSAKPLCDLLSGGEPLVWEDPEGALRGASIKPIHRAAPFAARCDSGLHAGLALVDAIRGGQARERQLAEEKLREWLDGE